MINIVYEWRLPKIILQLLSQADLAARDVKSGKLAHTIVLEQKDIPIACECCLCLCFSLHVSLSLSLSLCLSLSVCFFLSVFPFLSLSVALSVRDRASNLSKSRFRGFVFDSEFILYNCMYAFSFPGHGKTLRRRGLYILFLDINIKQLNVVDVSSCTLCLFFIASGLFNL